MTFLEYVCWALLGDPVSHGQPGESYYECPWCGEPKLHTLPHKKQYADKWRCFVCINNPRRRGFGDERDLIRHFFPTRNVDAMLGELSCGYLGHDHDHGAKKPNPSANTEPSTCGVQGSNQSFRPVADRGHAVYESLRSRLIDEAEEIAACACFWLELTEYVRWERQQWMKSAERERCKALIESMEEDLSPGI